MFVFMKWGRDNNTDALTIVETRKYNIKGQGWLVKLRDSELLHIESVNRECESLYILLKNVRTSYWFDTGTIEDWP